MENFLLSVPLASGIITGHCLTLDGLLGGIVFRRTGDVAAARDGLPLARSHGVYHGSAVMLEYPCRIDRHMINASFVAEARRDPSFAHKVRPNKPGKPLLKIDGKRGEFKTDTSEYQVHQTTAVHFLGRGDVAAIRRLMVSVAYIGTKRSHGYGQIARPTDSNSGHVRFEIDGVDQDNPWFGIFSQGHVLRPVPVRLLPDFGVTPQKYRTSHETWRNPYRDAEGRESCVVPAGNIRHASQIRQLCV